VLHSGTTFSKGAALRWTARAHRKIRVQGSFRVSVNDGDRDVFIRFGGEVFLEKRDTRTDESFDFETTVEAGDTLDFSVGTGPTWTGEATGLEVRITALTGISSPGGSISLSPRPVDISSDRSQSLNGKWKILFDRENLRVPYFLAAGGVSAHAEAEDIQVPSIWNLHNPSVRSYTGAAIYETQFLARPEGFDAAILRFQAVNYIAEVWLNGVRVGTHEGGYLPFGFDISRHLQPGKMNTLTVRVINLDRAAEFEGRKINSGAIGKETWYYQFGGIYRDVGITYHKAARIGTVKIDTALDGTIHEKNSRLFLDNFPSPAKGMSAHPHPLNLHAPSKEIPFCRSVVDCHRFGLHCAGFDGVFCGRMVNA